MPKKIYFFVKKGIAILKVLWYYVNDISCIGYGIEKFYGGFEKMKMTKVLAVIASAAVAATAMATVASAADYNAYIQFQTTSYSFRNDWTEASYGQATDYFDSYIVWGSGDAPEETFPQYEDNFDYDIAGYVLPATYTDAVITGDGTYTVEASGLDWSVTGDSGFNTIGVSTNLPAEGVTVSDVKLYVDGVETMAYDAAVVEGLDNNTYLKINVINVWNTECTTYTGAFPAESIKVEFTVSGLGGAAAEDATTAGDVDASTDSSKGSPDTGIEDVAVIGGLAVLAGAAIAFTRKRK